MIYGSIDRLESLRRFLRAAAATVGDADGDTGGRVAAAVVSHGYTGVVRRALEFGGLLEYFDDVIGSDHAVAEACAGDKCLIARELMRRHGVGGADSILIDDDYRNLVHTRCVCQTFWVFSRQGLSEEELARLAAWAAVTVTGEAGGGPTSGSCPPRYSADKALLLPAPLSSYVQETQAFEYVHLSKRGVGSVDAAVALCNRVPAHAIVEKAKLVSLPVRGEVVTHLLYTSAADLSWFESLVRCVAGAERDRAPAGVPTLDSLVARFEEVLQEARVEAARSAAATAEAEDSAVAAAAAAPPAVLEVSSSSDVASLGVSLATCDEGKGEVVVEATEKVLSEVIAVVCVWKRLASLSLSRTQHTRTHAHRMQRIYNLCRSRPGFARI